LLNVNENEALCCCKYYCYPYPYECIIHYADPKQSSILCPSGHKSHAVAFAANALNYPLEILWSQVITSNTKKQGSEKMEMAARTEGRKRKGY
jgi:hypothetical protein